MTAHAAATTVVAIAGISLAGLIVTASTPEAPQRPAAAIHKTPVELGKYLVNTMGCHDCHTPWTMGPKGPGPDMSRALTGHPEGLTLTAPPAPQEAPADRTRHSHPRRRC